MSNRNLTTLLALALASGCATPRDPIEEIGYAYVDLQPAKGTCMFSPSSDGVRRINCQSATMAEFFRTYRGATGEDVQLETGCALSAFNLSNVLPQRSDFRLFRHHLLQVGPDTYRCGEHFDDEPWMTLWFGDDEEDEHAKE